MISYQKAFRNLLKRRDEAIKNEKSQELKTNLFNETNFYPAFVSDALSAKKEVIIYSPFVSKHRTVFLKTTIQKLRDRNIDVFIFTRPLEEYENIIRPQIEVALKRLEEIGVSVFHPGRYIHEKVAIIDRQILWEGSLNILSHRASNEMMRRIDDPESAVEVINHIKVGKSLAEAYKIKYENMYRDLVQNDYASMKIKIRFFLLGIMTATWIAFAIYLLISIHRIIKFRREIIIFTMSFFRF